MLAQCGGTASAKTNAEVCATGANAAADAAANTTADAAANTTADAAANAAADAGSVPTV